MCWPETVQCVSEQRLRGGGRRGWKEAGAPLYVILKGILRLQTWLSLKRVATEGFRLERELGGPRKTNLEATMRMELGLH